MSAPEKKKVDVDGIELSYEEYGEGELILFVHGFGASSYSWRRVAMQLAHDGWRCICLDLMGFGSSATPRHGPYTLERQAQLIGGFVIALRAPAVHLVGHSYGGGACLVLLDSIRRDPLGFDLRALILADTVCYPQEFPSFIKLLRTPLINWVSLNLVPARISSRSMLEFCYYSKDKITEEAVVEYANGITRSGGQEALVATARQIIPSDMHSLVASYRKIRIPTLLIWGDHDRIIPLESGRRLSEEMPSATLEVFEKCGHVPQEEYPEETSLRIRSFLETVK